MHLVEYIYWNIFKMHGHINVKSANIISKWQMGFNSAFKGLTKLNNQLCFDS
jgi:formylmethanofuran dehydrogenase subunit B